MAITAVSIPSCPALKPHPRARLRPRSQEKGVPGWELVKEHREIVRAILARYRGEEHGTAGDSFFVLFTSAVEAVQCAVEIQEAFHQRNEGKPEIEQIWIRIGIHLGDILVDHSDNQVYGDGVNIAARTEPLAEPGGICITRDVYQQVHNKLELRAVCIGRREMKNIIDAPELYQLLLSRDARTTPDQIQPIHHTALKWVLWALATIWPMVLIAFSPNEYFSEIIGAPSSNQIAIGLISKALLLAAFGVALWTLTRLWFRGVGSCWIINDRVFLPIAAILGGVGLTYSRYTSLLDFYNQGDRNYLSVDHARGTAAHLASVVAQFLNSTSLASTIILAGAWLVLMASFFVSTGQPWRWPGRRLWGTVATGTIVLAACQLTFSEAFSNTGLFMWGVASIWLVPTQKPLSPRNLIRKSKIEGGVFRRSTYSIGATNALYKRTCKGNTPDAIPYITHPADPASRS